MAQTACQLELIWGRRQCRVLSQSSACHDHEKNGDRLFHDVDRLVKLYMLIMEQTVCDRGHVPLLATGTQYVCKGGVYASSPLMLIAQARACSGGTASRHAPQQEHDFPFVKPLHPQRAARRA